MAARAGDSWHSGTFLEPSGKKFVSTELSLSLSFVDPSSLESDEKDAFQLAFRRNWQLDLGKEEDLS